VGNGKSPPDPPFRGAPTCAEAPGGKPIPPRACFADLASALRAPARSARAWGPWGRLRRRYARRPSGRASASRIANGRDPRRGARGLRVTPVARPARPALRLLAIRPDRAAPPRARPRARCGAPLNPRASRAGGSGLRTATAAAKEETRSRPHFAPEASPAAENSRDVSPGREISRRVDQRDHPRKWVSPSPRPHSLPRWTAGGQG
jgi:hypothetical protein